MPNLVVVVMPDLQRFHEVLDAWEKKSVTGVTILESLGLHKVQQLRARRDDLPLFPSLRHLLESEEYHHRTAFVVVDDDFDLDGLIEATEQARWAATWTRPTVASCSLCRWRAHWECVPTGSAARYWSRGRACLF